METFYETLTNEEKSFNLPGWAWLIIMPIALIALLGLAGWFDTHGM